MNQQEQGMLQGLTDRVNSTQLSDKDPEAEQFLAQTLGHNPDATYILAQTVLVTQYALEAAQKQLQDARSQLEAAQQQAAQAPPPQKHTSFLSGLLGGHDDRPAPPPPPVPQQGQYAAVPYSEPAAYPSQYPAQPYPVAPPQYGQANYGAPMSGMGGSQGGGFLRGAMQTATGVAAGALAFEGFESLMHGFGHSGGGGYGLGGFGGGGGGQTEVVNNYYGDNERGGGDFASRLSPDIEDRRDEHAGQSLGGNAGSQFADATDDGYANDNSSDDAGSDFADTSTDDGGGFDSSSDDNNS